jgi:hypothetical protein
MCTLLRRREFEGGGGRREGDGGRGGRMRENEIEVESRGAAAMYMRRYECVVVCEVA